MTDTTETTTETEMAAEDTRCVLVYRQLIEHKDGRYERGEDLTVLGDEDGGRVAERCVCDSDEHALDVFLDNLTDTTALAGYDCRNLVAEDVTESEGFCGWDTVVRQSWTTLDGEQQSCLYSVYTVPAAEWLADDRLHISRR